MNGGTLPTPDGGTWHVTQAQQTVGNDQTGKAVKGMLVTYQLASGQAGTVFVPGDQPTPDTVTAAVSAAAANLAGILNLTSKG
jgi:hypothetical protein